jgi:hypothetical protein
MLQRSEFSNDSLSKTRKATAKAGHGNQIRARNVPPECKQEEMLR